MQLPTYVIDILKLGENSNFNNRFDNKLALDYVKNFETFLKNDIDKENILKLTFLNTIKKFYNKNLATNLHVDKKFKIDFEKTKNFIKHNPDILITRADKGNETVTIKKSIYLEKTELLFC